MEEGGPCCWWVDPSCWLSPMARRAEDGEVDMLRGVVVVQRVRCVKKREREEGRECV